VEPLPLLILISIPNSTPIPPSASTPIPILVFVFGSVFCCSVTNCCAVGFCPLPKVPPTLLLTPPTLVAVL
jgi:hypothetical protein